MNDSLPSRCFISHAYADLEIRNRLLTHLPPNVKPFIFPRITVSPHEFVSHQLIKALLHCDGLLYLDGGASEHSFWVAFERDYALRATKQVFAVNPQTLAIVPHSQPPLDLATFASYHHSDRERVLEITGFLRRERYFDLWVDSENLQPGDFYQQEITGAITNRLRRGGYVVVFWSRSANESKWVASELRLAADEMVNLNDRVLFALLDETPLPAFWSRFQEPSVQLYSDSERPALQRRDDLVVRLYWLIYRKTHRRDLEGSDT